jgi:hypothetical protein
MADAHHSGKDQAALRAIEHKYSIQLLSAEDACRALNNDGANLVGRRVLCKWKALGQGGWSLGKVTDCIQHRTPDNFYNGDVPGVAEVQASVNYTVKYVDDRVVEHHFYEENYVNRSDGFARSDAWALVRPALLGGDQDRVIAGQVTARKCAGKGRAQKKRRAPSHGPTSKSPRKRAKKSD